MKINVTFDMTPEEFRKVLGLPEVHEFQQEFFNTVLEKMKSGEEGYDPVSLYQPMFNESMNAVSQFQNMMFKLMAGQGGSEKK
ncbi:MAG: hypothetical protein CMI08_16705 [Oceanospirillaceae bacterium]|uniref:hypothetical protein n=1 Tax=unclassified Thalassolituus TaxID=2624967 RepID=UPI000C0A6174|nr:MULTISPECIES: hypothetical protein [unclassified Thalassolituus]MAK91571.1 hypothetical protein [Thalassolituus sp.]MAY00808.1 hypothetical protein [Oceanospirillaceae bacterium]MBL34869.1 hypothetical protein [Oceanospirillaceae bacterium]MBS51641.1 hypothetical protein [Oceanospirillaceae bacterium]|tara:strand:- start:352 stop:600 length:249 start_codon:yes stop_codon:yes gene_type:complete